MGFRRDNHQEVCGGCGVIRFDQIVLSDRERGTLGDCTRACVQTLAGYPMTLPHPLKSSTEWSIDFFEKLEGTYGLRLMHQPVRPGKDYSFIPDICAAGGDTVRTPDNGASHMVVYDRVNGTVLHDPHPSRAGLTTIDSFYWLEEIEKE